MPSLGRNRYRARDDRGGGGGGGNRFSARDNSQSRPIRRYDNKPADQMQSQSSSYSGAFGLQQNGYAAAAYSQPTPQYTQPVMMSYDPSHQQQPLMYGSQQQQQPTITYMTPQQLYYAAPPPPPSDPPPPGIWAAFILVLLRNIYTWTSLLYSIP